MLHSIGYAPLAGPPILGIQLLRFVDLTRNGLYGGLKVSAMERV